MRQRIDIHTYLNPQTSPMPAFTAHPLHNVYANGITPVQCRSVLTAVRKRGWARAEKCVILSVQVVNLGFAAVKDMEIPDKILAYLREIPHNAHGA
jgi:hypothetical protein